MPLAVLHRPIGIWRAIVASTVNAARILRPIADDKWGRCVRLAQNVMQDNQRLRGALVGLNELRGTTLVQAARRPVPPLPRFLNPGCELRRQIVAVIVKPEEGSVGKRDRFDGRVP